MSAQPNLSGRTRLAGVAGRPVAHSLSPLLHNAWLAAAGIDAVYLAWPVEPDGFEALVAGLKGGVVLGLNVTLPFKGQAWEIADTASDRARAARAANLLVFEGGRVHADNTDGEGLLYAFHRQAPGWSAAAGPAVVLGAGGAALGAVAALKAAGAAEVRIVNRTFATAEAVARLAGGRAFDLDRAGDALADAATVVNATSAGLSGSPGLAFDWSCVPVSAVAMDMVYTPLRTAFLEGAAARGLRTVDGLDMLIGQAIPSFTALFGAPPPAEVDVRALALEALRAEAPA